MLLFNFFYLSQAILTAKTICNLIVVKVIDGETLIANLKGINHKIRLANIKTPELYTYPAWPFSKQAKEYVYKKLHNQSICISFNYKNKFDLYHRLVADVYLQSNNLWLNRSLITEGLAYTHITSSSNQNLTSLIKLENKVIQQHLNIWSLSFYQPITPDYSNNYIGQYKIIDGIITNISYSPKSIWLHFNKNNHTLFTIRIPKRLNFKQKYYLSLINQKVRVRGYIEQYNDHFSPFITIISNKNIDILK
ncbi:thermonuclease family protein [Rickettsiales bacterium LUAb2]